jgi:acyl-CoA synthetase (AMP-forming)/AMP-acid ligase II
MVVPTMLARIVEYLDATGDMPPPSIRSIAYGGALMPERVIARALELFPATDFANAYGLTETSSTIAVLGPEDHRAAVVSDTTATRARLASVGRALPGIEIEVRGSSGEVLGHGEAGDMYVRGAQVSGEYLGSDASVVDAGWFATRDRGWLDDQGYIFIEGRTDDTIIRGGENIAPAEIEDVLMHHPGVMEAAVVGLPDEEWGQQIVAVVVPRTGHTIDPSALQAFARERLRSSKTPSEIVVWPSLPQTDTGKILRREIHAQLQARRD